jgi:hypothetical protein
MKFIAAIILGILASVATAEPLSEIGLDSAGYDIGAFRKYSELKEVPPLRKNSIRVFFMHQGRVGKAIELSLSSGRCELWPDWFEKKEPIVFTIEHDDRAAVSSALVQKSLVAIPQNVMPSFDGTCHLIEIRNDEGYFWRLHRNSNDGYFLSLVSLLDMISRKADEKKNGA